MKLRILTLALILLAATVAALSAIATATIGSFALANESRQRTGLGLVAFNCAIRSKWMLQQDLKVDLFEPLPQVSGNDLARTLRFVREHPVKSLQEVGSLSLDKQVELEDANIAASVKYAREDLAL